MCQRACIGREEQDVWASWLQEAKAFAKQPLSDFLCSSNAFSLQAQYKLYSSEPSSPPLTETAASSALNHQWILVHKNGVLVVGLSLNHPAVRAAAASKASSTDTVNNGLTVKFVPSIADKTIRGKRRHGATQCQPGMQICTISNVLVDLQHVETEDQEKPALSNAVSFTVHCPVYGQIVEYNSNLKTYLHSFQHYSVDTIAPLLWMYIVVPHSRHQLQKSLDGLSPVTTRLASGFWLCLDGVNQDALLDAKKNDAYSEFQTEEDHK